MLLVQGKIHHWSTGVDLEAQPSVDLGKGQLRSVLSCGLRPEEPAEIVNKDKAPVNAWEDQIAESEQYGSQYSWALAMP